MTIAQDIIHYIIDFTNWLHDQLNASPMLSKKSKCSVEGWKVKRLET